MAYARRHDRSTFKKAATTAAGYLRADAYVTRAGVFEYRTADGKVTRELRHPDEVFHADSLESLALVPVTDLHPVEPVTSANARKYQAGAVGEVVERDGEYVKARVSVTDTDLIAKIMSGRHEVSCGYTCDVESQSGVYEGQPYDTIQKNIRYDHLAIVPRGRAGREVRLRMDGASQIAAENQHENEQEGAMEKIEIGGKVFEVSADLKAAYESHVQLLQKATQEAQGKTDALQKALDAEQAARKDAADPVKLQERIAARVALQVKASAYLGETKLDAMSDKDIKIAVIRKVDESIDVADKSDDYINGVFGVVTTLKKDSTGALLAAITPPKSKTDSKSPRELMIERNQNAWKKQEVQ